MIEILTQRDLVARARDELGIRVSTVRVHAWISAGMPTIPGGKKPRFSWPRCKAWLLGEAEGDPLTLQTRDLMLARRYRKTG